MDDFNSLFEEYLNASKSAETREDIMRALELGSKIYSIGFEGYRNLLEDYRITKSRVDLVPYCEGREFLESRCRDLESLIYREKETLIKFSDKLIESYFELLDF